MNRITLICNFDPTTTKKYREILEELNSLKKIGLYAHEGIGVRVYVNCNEAAGNNPWFTDDDMKYMKPCGENRFSLELDISDFTKFQYRYIAMYDIPLFKRIGPTMRHVYSLINTSELEQHMPTYFGNRILPHNFSDKVHEDTFNVISVKSRKGACIYPFKSLIGSSDGKVTVCCVDDRFKLDLGNMDDGFDRIWNGEKLKDLRLAHILGNFQDTPENDEGIPICLLCQEWFTPRLSPEELKNMEDDDLSSLYDKYVERIDCSSEELRVNINPYLTFELSSRCNLSCSFCSQKNSKLPQKSDMSLDSFSVFLDELVETKYEFDNINLFFRGESLLHREFPKFIEKIEEVSKRRKIFNFLVLHTNGLLLNEENGDSLLSIFSQRTLPFCGNMVVSIDSCREETYRKLRGGKLKRVENNLTNFIRKRKEKNQFGPNLIIQFIVFEENMDEISEFIEKWSEILSKESHKPFRVCATLENQPPIIDSDIIYFRVEASPGKGDPSQREKLYKERYLKAIKKAGLTLE